MRAGTFANRCSALALILKVTMPNAGAIFIASELKLEHSVSVGGYRISSVEPTQEVGAPLPPLLTWIGLPLATHLHRDWAGQAAIAAALASAPTKPPTADPCEFANDGTCDVPQYCAVGDYLDCKGGAGNDECRALACGGAAVWPFRPSEGLSIDRRGLYESAH